MKVITSDHSIPTDNGILFARRWTPADPHDDRGASLLLFHDSLGCVDLWRDFPRQLAIATGRPVLAYDRLGFGRSDPYPGILPLTFMRDEALTVPFVCEALGLETIIPFGHSVGGEMAIATAACLPERCAAVITESAQSFIEDQTLSGLHAAQAKFERPGQLERLEKYHGSKARWVVDAWINTWLSPGFAGWCLDDDLKGVRCPVLVLHGDQDEFGSPEHAHRIARLVQQSSRVVILEQCEHVPHRQMPTRVLDEVRQFLARLD